MFNIKYYKGARASSFSLNFRFKEIRIMFTPTTIATTINTTSVVLTVKEDGAVSFTVNGQMTIDGLGDNLPRVAITKWLLMQFDQLKLQYPYLFCYPLKGDKVNRKCIYTRLGFTPIKGQEYLLEWRGVIHLPLPH